MAVVGAVADNPTPTVAESTGPESMDTKSMDTKLKDAPELRSGPAPLEVDNAGLPGSTGTPWPAATTFATPPGIDSVEQWALTLVGFGRYNNSSYAELMTRSVYDDVVSSYFSWVHASTTASPQLKDFRNFLLAMRRAA